VKLIDCDGSTADKAHNLTEPSVEDPSLLIIALDTSPSQSILKKKPTYLKNIVDSVCAFGNAHLMQKPQNKLAVVSCHHHACQFLYPSTGRSQEIRQMDGQYEYFTSVEKTIKTNLADLIKNAPKAAANSNESLLAGCLAMVLCYISRVSYTIALIVSRALQSVDGFRSKKHNQPAAISTRECSW